MRAQSRRCTARPAPPASTRFIFRRGTTTTSRIDRSCTFRRLPAPRWGLLPRAWASGTGGRIIYSIGSCCVISSGCNNTNINYSSRIYRSCTFWRLPAPAFRGLLPGACASDYTGSSHACRRNNDASYCISRCTIFGWLPAWRLLLPSFAFPRRRTGCRASCGSRRCVPARRSVWRPPSRTSNSRRRSRRCVPTRRSVWRPSSRTSNSRRSSRRCVPARRSLWRPPSPPAQRNEQRATSNRSPKGLCERTNRRPERWTRQKEWPTTGACAAEHHELNSAPAAPAY